MYITYFSVKNSIIVNFVFVNESWVLIPLLQIDSADRNKMKQKYKRVDEFNRFLEEKY